MQKWFFKIFMVAASSTYFFSPAANAILGFGANNNAPAAAAAPAPSGPMTPDQFKSTVKNLNQQFQSDMTKQKQDQVAKSTAPTVGKPSTSSSTATTAATTATTTQTTTTPSSSTTTTSTTAQPSIPKPAVSPTPTMSGAAPATTAPTPPPNYGSQAPQAPVYTGFGPANPSSTTAPAPNKSSSGGWNIQY